jgi:hypothetical protein
MDGAYDFEKLSFIASSHLRFCFDTAFHCLFLGPPVIPLVESICCGFTQAHSVHSH